MNRTLLRLSTQALFGRRRGIVLLLIAGALVVLAVLVRLPQVARDHGIRISEVTPTDESLESVFAYLVGG